jgi:hypothetical protein
MFPEVYVCPDCVNLSRWERPRLRFSFAAYPAACCGELHYGTRPGSVVCEREAEAQGYYGRGQS